jgi:hypothetical protein
MNDYPYYTSISFGNTLDGSFFYELVHHVTLTHAKECTDRNVIRPGFRGCVIIKSHKGSWFDVHTYNRHLVDIDWDTSDMKWIVEPSNEYINIALTPLKLYGKTNTD